MQRYCLIVVVALSLLRCSTESATVPLELQGTFETSRAGYEGALLQIGPQTIAWKDVEGHVRSHRVTAVVNPQSDREGRWTLRHEIEGTADAAFTFRIAGDRLVPDNQRELVWHRRSR